MILSAGADLLVPAAGGGTILATAIAFTIALMRQSTRQNEAMAEQNRELRQEMLLAARDGQTRIDGMEKRLDLADRRERRCQRALAAAVNSLRTANLAIPEEVNRLVDPD